MCRKITRQRIQIMRYLGWFRNEPLLSPIFGDIMKFNQSLIILFLYTSTLCAELSSNNQLPKPQLIQTNLYQIDLNHASASMLIGSIKGIGRKRAEAIISYRDAHHGFKSLAELSEVKGISKHFVVTHQKELQQQFTIK